MKPHSKIWISIVCVVLLLTSITPTLSAQFSDTPPPVQPLRTWGLSLDGTVLVVDAENRLYRLGAADLTPEVRSKPLFEVLEGDRIFLTGDYLQAFVGSEAAGRTAVVDLVHGDLLAVLDKAGPVAVDGSGRLFMISEWNILAYDLSDLTRPPEVVVPGPNMGLGLVPMDLWVNPAQQLLYVRLHDSSSSPPHQRDFYRTHRLSDMMEVGLSEGQLGVLTRPAIVPTPGIFLSTLYSKSPFYSGNKLLLFDAASQVLHEWQPFDGLPTITQDGAVLYLLRQRGIWILSGKDMSVQGVLPVTEAPPADVRLSPYGERLYLLGNGWLQSLRTEELQAVGFQPVSPFPLAWTDEETNHRPYSEAPQFRVYASPQMAQDGTALVQVDGYGETYRSTDGGHSWSLVRSLAYPNLQETPRLSLSPEFAFDHTLIGHFDPIRRSTDAAETWSEWSPRVAFVSDRSGNREVYTMETDGSAVLQVTANQAADETPAWSPAWTRIAFQSNRNGNWDIFSIDGNCDVVQSAANCDEQQLTLDSADDMLPAWSPDGRSIAFVSTRDGNPEIYVMNQDGSNPRRLTWNPGGDWRPAWMADSRHILFTSDRSGNNDIYSISVPAPDDPPPSGEIDLQPVITGPSDDRDAAVSASDKLLFLSDRDGIMRTYTLDLNTPYSSPLALHAHQEVEAHPAWIDDRGYAALVTLEWEGVTNIYRACYGCEYEPVTQGQGFDGHPAWGPVWWQPDVAESLEWLKQQQW